MLDRLLNPDAVCPVTAALLESASRNHEKWERQLMPGPPQRAGKTGTLKRKLLIMETVIRKYAPEALRTAKRNTAAKMLTDEPELVRAANLAEEISGILWGRNRRQRPAPHMEQEGNRKHNMLGCRADREAPRGHRRGEQEVRRIRRTNPGPLGPGPRAKNRNGGQQVD